jgi:predicted glutamine amidotransferase
VFAHNGTIPNFDRVSVAMRAAMTADHRAAIQGTTDSEQIFRLMLSVRERSPSATLVDALQETMAAVITWSWRFDPRAPLGLNVLLSDGQEIVGTRWGRSLVVVERRGVRDCEVCGFPHVHHDPRHDYRAVVVASEPITHERWRELPDRSIFRIGADLDLSVQPLDPGRAPSMMTGGVAHVRR